MSSATPHKIRIADYAQRHGFTTAKNFADTLIRRAVNSSSASQTSGIISARKDEHAREVNDDMHYLYPPKIADFAHKLEKEIWTFLGKFTTNVTGDLVDVMEVHDALVMLYLILGTLYTLRYIYLQHYDEAWVKPFLNETLDFEDFSQAFYRRKLHSVTGMLSHIKLLAEAAGLEEKNKLAWCLEQHKRLYLNITNEPAPSEAQLVSQLGSNLESLFSDFETTIKKHNAETERRQMILKENEGNEGKEWLSHMLGELHAFIKNDTCDCENLKDHLRNRTVLAMLELAPQWLEAISEGPFKSVKIIRDSWMLIHKPVFAVAFWLHCHVENHKVTKAEHEWPGIEDEAGLQWLPYVPRDDLEPASNRRSCMRLIQAADPAFDRPRTIRMINTKTIGASVWDSSARPTEKKRTEENLKTVLNIVDNALRELADKCAAYR